MVTIRTVSAASRWPFGRPPVGTTPDNLGRAQFDLVINMSGFDLPDEVGPDVRMWDVPDPVYLQYDEHCEVRDEIERLVMTLILELRDRQREQTRPFESARGEE